MTRRFRDRSEAGEVLADLLAAHEGSDGVVLGLPRGGVPVAAPVARRLGMPLDVLLVRKLGVPGHEELAMGAIASGDVIVWSDEVLSQVRVSERERSTVVERERAELSRREQTYRSGRPPLDVRGRLVVVVDDGIATGSTMAASVAALQASAPSRVIAAAPVASRSAIDLVAAAGEAAPIEVVVAEVPLQFRAVGEWYVDFRATTDVEVVDLLRGDAR